MIWSCGNVITTPAYSGGGNGYEEGNTFRRRRGGDPGFRGRRPSRRQKDARVRRERRVGLLEGRRGRRQEGAGRTAELHPRVQISRTVVRGDPDTPDGRPRRRR